MAKPKTFKPYAIGSIMHNYEIVSHLKRVIEDHAWSMKYVVKCLKCLDEIELGHQTLSINENHQCSCMSHKGRLSDMSILLEDLPQSYYWIGFILADGHIHNSAGLHVTLSIKDEKHLEKLKNYISFSGDLYYRKSKSNKFVGSGRQIVSLNANHASVLKKLCKKFSISNRKTYVPCNLNGIIDDILFVSLVIGYIDGDGSMQKMKNSDSFRVDIVGHENQLENFNYISRRISGIVDVPSKKVYKKGDTCIVLSMSNHNIINLFLETIKNHDLPVLNRKWKKLFITGPTRYDLAKERRQIILQELSKGKNMSEISRIIGISEVSVRKAVNKYKLKDMWLSW